MFNQSYEVHITSLVINSLERGHTQTRILTIRTGSILRNQTCRHVAGAPGLIIKVNIQQLSTWNTHSHTCNGKHHNKQTMYGTNVTIICIWLSMYNSKPHCLPFSPPGFCMFLLTLASMPTHHFHSQQQCGKFDVKSACILDNN